MNNFQDLQLLQEYNVLSKIICYFANVLIFNFGGYKNIFCY